MASLTDAFRGIVGRMDLVRSHSFDRGFDDGAYYNFDFRTARPAELWRLIQDTVLQAPAHAAHLAIASMAMCSGEEGWNDYVQLYHWDPEVPVVSAATL